MDPTGKVVAAMNPTEKVVAAMDPNVAVMKKGQSDSTSLAEQGPV
jgi:hypothetical protein